MRNTKHHQFPFGEVKFPMVCKMPSAKVSKPTCFPSFVHHKCIPKPHTRTNTRAFLPLHKWYMDFCHKKNNPRFRQVVIILMILHRTLFNLHFFTREKEYIIACGQGALGCQALHPSATYLCSMWQQLRPHHKRWGTYTSSSTITQALHDRPFPSNATSNTNAR